MSEESRILEHSVMDWKVSAECVKREPRCRCANISRSIHRHLKDKI